jgi:hypothetical protein
MGEKSRGLFAYTPIRERHPPLDRPTLPPMTLPIPYTDEDLARFYAAVDAHAINVVLCHECGDVIHKGDWPWCGGKAGGHRRG